MQRLVVGLLLGNRYVLTERIASGGMADVWMAVDDVVARNVSVKVMRADPDNEEVFAERFRDEALHAAALMHTNITTVFDYGEDDGLSYLVMELVPGLPLSAVIREQGALEPDTARSILAQAALALGIAHEAGVVHRDVKPANILVRSDGVVKLTDFGIARATDAIGHTRLGEMLGTPNYISPEQARGEVATGASDLYALGVVAHEMLTGTRPFDRGTPIATAMSHVTEPPPPLGDEVPEDLRTIIEQMLEKDPADRPDNARSVAAVFGATTLDLDGTDLALAEEVASGYVARPTTPTPPSFTPAEFRAGMLPDLPDPAAEPAPDAGASSGAGPDLPTVSARPEDLLD